MAHTSGITEINKVSECEEGLLLEGFGVENSICMRTAFNLTKPQLNLSSAFRMEEKDRWVSLSMKDMPCFYFGGEYRKNVREVEVESR